jgi:hypothetical protein
MEVILAPHHDDAILSLGGYLASPAPTPRTVVVVFSEEDPALAAACTRAHAAVGAAVVTLGFVEAERRGIPVRERFRATRSAAAVWADPLARAVRAQMRGMLQSYAEAVFFAPLLTVHLDHAVVRAAIDDVRGETRLLLYEDMPYAALFPRLVEREARGMDAVTLPASKPPPAVQSLQEALRGLVPQRHLWKVSGALERAETLRCWRPRR